MADPEIVHRLTILSLIVIMLGGGVYAPALAIGFITFMGGGGLLIVALILIALVLLVLFAVLLARAFRPR